MISPEFVASPNQTAFEEAESTNVAYQLKNASKMEENEKSASVQETSFNTADSQVQRSLEPSSKKGQLIFLISLCILHVFAFLL